jgi:hypothetical protein
VFARDVAHTWLVICKVPHVLKINASYVFALSLLGCAAADDTATPEAIGDATAPFSTTPHEPNHEAITSSAFDFLKPEVVAALVAANVETDVQFVLVSANHFDNCDFSGGSQVVASNQATAVGYLAPAALDTPAADAQAIVHFARSLHALQDFYAHTNWVELGGDVLLDESSTAFPTLRPYSSVPSSSFVIVQGAKPKKVELTRKAKAPYPASASVTVKWGPVRALGLISGTVDYEAGVFCPPPVAMTHEQLNKDQSSTPGRAAQHEAAKALAIAQSRHEWCRLTALVQAAYGDTSRLAAWVAEGSLPPDCAAE